MGRRKKKLTASEAAKLRESKKPPTPRQSRFAKAFMESRNLAEAAIAAGYSPKNPSESGAQALRVMAPKISEMMDDAGLSVKVLIQKYLAPLLDAKQTKFAIEKGEFTDSVDVEDNSTRKDALDIALRMHGAYAPRDADPNQANGVRVIIMDMPRPRLPLGDLPPGADPTIPTNGNTNGRK
jgi:hypothetical protein